jgi:F-type H+-transporting ATPase subunit alpha
LGAANESKTAIAVDVIANQKDKDVICVYCAMGQRSASVARVISALDEKQALDYTVVVVAEANEALGLLYLAPYAATTVAEFFRDRGQHALVVYDDLTSHARAYRSISLLLRRPPGREAFPGDVFYLHSRLLERATQLAPELGGGSLTALPIIETEAQNLAAYIPTNLISITDGQLYFSPDLFQKGILPAIDVGKSVSRVGGKAQLAAYRAVAGDLKLAYSQFEELEVFSRFGTRLDEQTRKSIEHGNRVRECLKQNELEPVTVIEQITLLITLTAGLFDTVPLGSVESSRMGSSAGCVASCGSPKFRPRVKALTDSGMDGKNRRDASALSVRVSIRPLALQRTSGDRHRERRATNANRSVSTKTEAAAADELGSVILDLSPQRVVRMATSFTLCPARHCRSLATPTVPQILGQAL